MASLKPKGKWPLLLAVPENTLSTEKARGVLPQLYSREDVVANLQNSMLMFTAFSQGRPELLPAALQDRIHQPYRASLCPLLPALQELEEPGILGVALSGAGPSVLIFLEPGANQKGIERRIEKYLTAKRLRAELLPAAITLHGARVSWRSL
jgi:homoserine kinase